jgi:hypothetical protein
MQFGGGIVHDLLPIRRRKLARMLRDIILRTGEGGPCG